MDACRAGVGFGLQGCLASVERGATHALTFASGLAATNAITTMLAAEANECKPHALVCDDVYGGTCRLFTKCTAVRFRQSLQSLLANFSTRIPCGLHLRKVE